jgi:hypothetical protein
MKRIIVFFLSFMMCSISYAAPTYGTRMPKQKQIYGGLQSYSVLNHHLEDNYGKISSQQEFALISIGVFDWMSLDFKGGAGNIDSRPKVGPDINYNTFLGGGYGLRFKFYDDEHTKAVFGFQHISIHPWSKSVNGIKNKAVLDDWQFSLLASHDLWNMSPYVGTRFAWMNQIHWMNGTRKLEKSDLGRSVGLVVGTDIPLSSRTWLNVEGQFFDTPSVAGSINFSF